MKLCVCVCVFQPPLFPESKEKEKEKKTNEREQNKYHKDIIRLNYPSSFFKTYEDFFFHSLATYFDFQFSPFTLLDDVVEMIFVFLAIKILSGSQTQISPFKFNGALIRELSLLLFFSYTTPLTPQPIPGLIWPGLTAEDAV